MRAQVEKMQVILQITIATYQAPEPQRQQKKLARGSNQTLTAPFNPFSVTD